MTNTLELIKPKDERLPFVCELNFTAAGGIHGDIVQVNILFLIYTVYLFTSSELFSFDELLLLFVDYN